MIYEIYFRSKKDNKNCSFLDSRLMFLISPETMGPLLSIFLFVSFKSEKDRDRDREREREGQRNRDRDSETAMKQKKKRD